MNDKALMLLHPTPVVKDVIQCIPVRRAVAREAVISLPLSNKLDGGVVGSAVENRYMGTLTLRPGQNF
jgi:hypothetical protein